ncbi:uncharacterized protein AC631_01398 [Debaryomyces fabryi]|uniref:Uncharacterized protein n=1 Tax=Debaryomyces fabryi TaxID=58627 RepID=A0A0V1Q2P4_9ASCO|nr:uncharacterized protein AC631_01398 [Debaryomyces fabryi]KSA02801.1 hypothetical protein AC631_01398 [Debaryomyces fabryi]CUM46093.1 unnamed protein product [Debaryomyces fabryi]
MLKKDSPGYYENLTISKCKRIVRPLVSKIHALNDLNSKYPSMLDFNFPHDDECLQGILSKKSLDHDNNVELPVYYQQGPVRRKIRKLEKRKNAKCYDYDSDYDESDYLLETSSINIYSSPEVREHISRMNSLIEPLNSSERLKSLKPYISSQLYQAYYDIFLIFRTIINSLILKTQRNFDSSLNIPKLSSLCSFKIGKFMALSTKPTYFEMNHSLLFDPDTIPYHLRKYLDILLDDIDEWLEMKPEVVTFAHRIDLLFGYVMHLLVINLDLTLYLLIPILIHWLNEELRRPGNKMLQSLSRNFFVEYWTYGPDYFENTGFEGIASILTGSQKRERNLNIFWIFHKIGYWKNLINSFDCKSATAGLNSYEVLILDTIPLNNKLSLNILTNLDTEKQDFLGDIYPMIKKNPQHPQINNILILIITQLISTTRLKIKQCLKIHDFLDCFQFAYDSVISFVHTWLFLPVKEELLVFNSLYPGNNEIFHALISFADFQIRQCDKCFLNLTKSRSSFPSKVNIDESFIIKLETIRDDLSIVKRTLELLRLYYLDTVGNFIIEPHNVEEISTFILSIQKAKANSFKVKEFPLCNNSYNDLLIWLFDQQDPTLLQISRLCFRKYYGNKSSFKNDLIDNLYCMLFEGDAITSSSSEEIDDSRLDNSDDDIDEDEDKT